MAHHIIVEKYSHYKERKQKELSKFIKYGIPVILILSGGFLYSLEVNYSKSYTGIYLMILGIIWMLIAFYLNKKWIGSK